MAGGWAEPGKDPRVEHGYTTERDLLGEYLANYRLTLSMKCEGLSPAQLATRSVPPSTMSLLGLIRHMVGVEHYWFRNVLAGETSPRPYRTPEDFDADFNGAIASQDVVDEAFAHLKDEIAFAEQFVQAAESLEIRGVDRHGNTVILRDVLIHMVEEYARHCGHADLLREAIDGRTGY
jgi:uncharacterized damage-inducible protein DinB